MSNTFISGGELVAQTLNKLGVECTFTLVGNQISPILIHTEKYNIDTIGVRHEQAAVHIADAWSQVKKQPGIAIISGGPGFTNAITGIVKAHMAATPLVIIVGSMIHKQRNKGELQDLYQLEMVRSYVKLAISIGDTARIPSLISKAIYTAISGRRGPVVVEIPINILKNEIVNNIDLTPSHYLANQSIPNFQYSIKTTIAEQLHKSSKPLIIIGDDAYYANASNAILKFIELTTIPVFTINKARGIVSDCNPNCFGNGRCIDGGFNNEVFKEADIIVNIGVSPDYQMVFFQEPIFNPAVQWVHIFNAENEFIVPDENNTMMMGNVKHTIELINEHIIQSKHVFSFNEWQEKIHQIKRLFEEQNVYTAKCQQQIHPKDVFNYINASFTDNALYVLDGSNAMFWGMSLIKCTIPGQLIIAPDGRFGPMGTGLPLAIGAKLAEPKKHVVLYTGDGSFGFNLMELDTLARLNLPLLIIVHNDACWGLCESTQDLLYKENASVKLTGTSYDHICKGFGIDSHKVTSITELNTAISYFLQHQKSMCLDIVFDSKLLSPGTMFFNDLLTNMR